MRNFPSALESQTWAQMQRGIGVAKEFNFRSDQLTRLHQTIRCVGGVDIVGLGSSVRFPANNMRYLARRTPETKRLNIQPMGGREALEYFQDQAVVVLMSNSGQTKEILDVAAKLTHERHPHLFAVTTNPDSELAMICGAQNTVTLDDCKEGDVVPATQSVIAQTLSLMVALKGKDAFSAGQMEDVAGHLYRVLQQNPINDELIGQMGNAHGLHFSGPNNGSILELNLKFWEACHRRTVNTYTMTEIIHGPQQSFLPRKHERTPETPKDVALLYDPRQEDESTLRTKLSHAHTWSVMSRETDQFPRIHLEEPPAWEFKGLGQLVNGWRIMMQLADHQGVHANEIDYPDHLSKVAYTNTPAPA